VPILVKVFAVVPGLQSESAEERSMSRITSTGVFVVLAAATLGAQAPSGKAQGRNADQPGATITVVGCMQAADADGSVAGTPLGTSATPAQAGPVANLNEPVNGFILTGARPAGSPDAPVATAGGNPSGSAGTAGSGAAAPAGANDAQTPRTYVLEGNQAELATHKGHRVEVTGTVASPVPSDSTVGDGRNPRSPATAGSGSGNAPARGSDLFQTGVPRLRVSSLRMVSAECSGGTQR
jgi:hypothetical protein